MKKLLCIPVMFLLVLAFSVFPAVADQGVAIEVINKTGKQLPVRLEIKSWGGDKDINRSAGVGDTLQFSKAETAHAAGAMVPSWNLYFNAPCVYQILSNTGDTCQLATPITQCALPEKLDTCSYRFTVAE
jgi:hypothetical protein